MFALFRDWVKYSLTLEYISHKYKIGIKTLYLRFKVFIKHPPSSKEYLKQILSTKSQKQFSGYLHIDGDYFGERVLIVYWDSKGDLLFWSWARSETLEQMQLDIKTIIENGYSIKSIVSDGRRSVKTIKNQHLT
ncbi:hypothetical protein DRH14_01640 [Candidatus Shapirobacteria bacterium]|nr:MAG: hypothetical protein DRH14_01640 [Candidatus Shapirobacteria bacterium]